MSFKIMAQANTITLDDSALKAIADRVQNLPFNKAVTELTRVFEKYRFTDEKPVMKLWNAMISRSDRAEFYAETKAVWPVFPVQDIDNLFKGDETKIVAALNIFFKRPYVLGELDFRAFNFDGVLVPESLDLKNIRLIFSDLDPSIVPPKLIERYIETGGGTLDLSRQNLDQLSVNDSWNFSRFTEINLSYCSSDVPKKLIELILETATGDVYLDNVDFQGVKLSSNFDFSRLSIFGAKNVPETLQKWAYAD